MNHRSALSRCLLTGVSFLALAGLLFGQGQGRGIITGLVADKTGSAIEEATVTVTNEATGVKIVVDTFIGRQLHHAASGSRQL